MTVIHGSIYQAGGGTIELYVDRDTDQYFDGRAVVVDEATWTGWVTGTTPSPIVGSPDLRDMFQQLRDEYGDQRLRAVCVAFINTFDGRDEPANDTELRQWCVEHAIRNGASGGFTVASDAQTLYEFITGNDITPEIRDTFGPPASKIQILNSNGQVVFQQQFDPTRAIRIANLANMHLDVNEILILPAEPS